MSGSFFAQNAFDYYELNTSTSKVREKGKCIELRVLRDELRKMRDNKRFVLPVDRDMRYDRHAWNIRIGREKAFDELISMLDVVLGENQKEAKTR